MTIIFICFFECKKPQQIEKWQERKNERSEYLLNTYSKVTKTKKSDEKKVFDRKSGFSVDYIVSSYILKQLFSVRYTVEVIRIIIIIIIIRNRHFTVKFE